MKNYGLLRQKAYAKNVTLPPLITTAYPSSSFKNSVGPSTLTNGGVGEDGDAETEYPPSMTISPDRKSNV